MNQDLERASYKNRDRATHITAKKNETARPVKFDEIFARPRVFEGALATS